MGIGASSWRVQEQLEKLTGKTPFDGKVPGRNDCYWFGSRALKDLEVLLGGNLANVFCKKMGKALSTLMALH